MLIEEIVALNLFFPPTRHCEQSEAISIIAVGLLRQVTPPRNDGRY